MKVKSLYISYMGLTEPLLYSQVLNYLKALSQKGVLIHILSFEKKEYLIKENIAAIRKELEKYRIKWFFLKYHKRSQFLSKPYDILRGIFFVLYICLKERIDIIHARSTFCALMGYISSLSLRKKLIFDMRGLMAEEYADAGLWKRGGFRYKLTGALERHFIKKSDELIILTSKTKDLILRKDIIKHINIIPSCVDLNRFNIVRKDYSELISKYSLGSNNILVYTGSLGTWYMLSEMVDFYKEVLYSGCNNARFLILSQTDRDWITRHIPAEFKEKIIVDYSEPGRVADFLNLCNIGISFIKPCLSKIASCPTKFAEYLACGLPVVINKGIGDTEEIVRENKIGVVIEDFNSQEYRKKIDDMTEILKEGESLRRRCRSVAERYFSLKMGGERYSEIYKRLASKSKRSLECD